MQGEEKAMKKSNSMESEKKRKEQRDRERAPLGPEREGEDPVSHKLIE